MAIKCMVKITEEQKNQVLGLLPEGYEMVITNFTEDPDGLFFEIRINLCSKEEALAWKANFQEKSNTTYLCDRTYEENSQKTVFKCVYHCLHNTRPHKETKMPHHKHTGCQAKLIINVKQKDMKRSKDVYLPTLPCVISVRHHHNHNIGSADVLRYKKPDCGLKEKFETLFSKGHTPTTALECFKLELQEEHGDEYPKVVADGSKCPTRNWCYSLYYKGLKKEYEVPAGLKMLESSKQKVDKYDSDCGEVYTVAGGDIDVKDLIVASNLVYSADETVTEKRSEYASQESIFRAEEQIKEVADILTEKLWTNPGRYIGAVSNFNKFVKEIKTDSALVSALHRFGRYSGLPRKKVSRGRRRTRVQRTAVSRRKRKLIARRQSVVDNDRPWNVHLEHSYYASI